MIRDRPNAAESRADGDLNTLDKAWVFTREYPNVLADALFDIVAKSLQDVPFFKVWKADNKERYIDLTTHSIRLSPKVNYHQVDVDLKVMEVRDSSSVLNIRVMPTLTGIVSLYELFTNVDVNDKFAKHVVNMIFETVEAGYRNRLRDNTKK